MSQRQIALQRLLTEMDLHHAVATPLAGDASARQYCRYRRPEGSTVMLMDWPRPPSAATSPVTSPGTSPAPSPAPAHIESFLRMAARLAAAGVQVPHIMASDLAHGYVLLEDFGNDSLSRVLIAHPDREAAYYHTAMAILIALQKSDLAALITDLPKYSDWVEGDFNYYQRELALFTEWYFSAITGANMPETGQKPSALSQEFVYDIWGAFLSHLQNLPPQLVLRDYHVDNLMVLPHRVGIKSLGLLDFQDALNGPGVYDVASLLRDVRRDVSPDVVQSCQAQYCQAMNYPADEFARDFALLALQRNFKILGLFIRLAWRDGKPQYLSYLDRVWHLVEQDLRELVKIWPGTAGHGDEADRLVQWLDHYCPPSRRQASCWQKLPGH